MKTMTMTMTNAEIYNYAVSLNNNFTNAEIQMPAAISFSIVKNKKTLFALAEDIERYRADIFNKYEAKLENNRIAILPEKVEAANKELEDLLKISQEVNIYTFSVEELKDISFTSPQMEAILFMIDEE